MPPQNPGVGRNNALIKFNFYEKFGEKMFQMSMGDAINIVYLIVATLLFLSVLGSMLSARFGLPLLLIFLGVGMLAGEEGLLKIHFSNFFQANLIGQMALAVILLDGGLRTSAASFRLVWKPAVVLASWGVLATVALLGLLTTWVLSLAIDGIDWRYGFLMAAIVGSTDAGAVFSLLRNGGVKLNERVQAILEIESGANDPMAILLVTGFIALNLDPHSQTVLSFGRLLLEQLGMGLVIGLVAGYAMSDLLPRVRLAEGLYALLIFSGGTITFALTNLAGGSGFLAIYLAGVVIGNRKTRATEHVLQVMDGMAWLAQVVLFVVLGMLVTPSHVLKYLPYAIGIFIFMTLLARPLAVFSGLALFGYNRREMAFISWVGLRGAVPVTLAIMPVMDRVPNAEILFDLTFAVVILSLLIQGMTLPIMSNVFRVRVPTIHEPQDSREIWVSNQSSINIVEFMVRKGAFAVGRNPDEIAKRVGADELRVFAFVREGQLSPLSNSTNLRSGDSVWYALNDDTHLETLAKVFNDTIVERREKSDFFGEWIVSPQVKMGDLAILDEVPLAEEERALTVNEFILFKSSVRPVVGDIIPISDDWIFVVRDTDNVGRVLAVGLKPQLKKESA